MRGQLVASLIDFNKTNIETGRGVWMGMFAEEVNSQTQQILATTFEGEGALLKKINCFEYRIEGLQIMFRCDLGFLFFYV